MTFLGSLTASSLALVLFLNFLESHSGWALFGFLDALFILLILGCNENQIRKGVLWIPIFLVRLICAATALALLLFASASRLYLWLRLSAKRRSAYPSPSRR